MAKKKNKLKEAADRQLMLNRVDAKLQAMFSKQNSINASQLVAALRSIGYEIQHVDNTVTIQADPVFKFGDIFTHGALFRGMPDHPIGVVTDRLPDVAPVILQKGTMLIDGIACDDAKKGMPVRIMVDASTKVEVQAGQGLARAHAAAVGAAELEKTLRARGQAPRVPPEVADRLKANHTATVRPKVAITPDKQPRVKHRPKAAAKKRPGAKRAT